MFSVLFKVQNNCTSYSFYIKIFNVSTLLLDDAFKSTTPLTNGVINETLQQFAPLNDILLLFSGYVRSPRPSHIFCLSYYVHGQSFQEW